MSNAITGWTLFLKKEECIFSPRRGQYILFLNVCVENCSSRCCFIDELSVRYTACESEGNNNKQHQLDPPRGGMWIIVFSHTRKR